jgi:hypothetical protein
MQSIDNATPALQLLMRRHESKVWEKGDRGEVKIGISVKGRGSPFEMKIVTSEMLAAAQRQVETGTSSLRGELDFPLPPPRRHSSGKIRRRSDR